MRMFIVFAMLAIMGCAQPITNFKECVDAGNAVMESYPQQCSANGKTFTEVINQSVGGDRTEKDCIGSAGYVWDADLGACVRSWELTPESRLAAKVAIMPYSMPLTLLSAEKQGCDNCFIVTLQRNDNQEKITSYIVDGEISDTPSMPANRHFCTDEEKAAEICTMDYTPVCGNDEKTYGNGCMACAAGAESYMSGECKGGEQHLCTDEEKSNQACTKEYMPVCGSDGNNYGNGCSACSAKIDSYRQGECEQKVIGGDKDAGGCLVGAGYSWSEEVGACIRTWELSAESRKAARIAADRFTAKMTILSVEYSGCEGCYIVALQPNAGEGREEVRIKDWKVESG